jgi:hypothetical protein
MIFLKCIRVIHGRPLFRLSWPQGPLPHPHADAGPRPSGDIKLSIEAITTLWALAAEPDSRAKFNDWRVVRLICVQGPQSRLEIGRRSGLSQPTVTKAVTSLPRARLLEEFEENSGPAGVGRPPMKLRLATTSAQGLGVTIAPSLSVKKVKRRLTVILAWSSPINPRHKDYLRAFLWFSSNKEVLAHDKKDHDFDSARRGTVQHQVFEGDKARVFSDGDAIEIKVSCAEDAGSCTDKIHYALAVTLEIAEPIDLRRLGEIQARIRLKVGVKPNGA